MFKPGTWVKVVRHLADAEVMVGDVGVVVTPARPYFYPVVVLIPSRHEPLRPHGEYSYFSFLEAELEPILDQPIEQEELAMVQ